jgi:hypothetical protein
MKNRNPLAVALLPFVTFGIYSIVWEVKTKNEMNALGAEIPTAWLLIVPIVSYYWLWKYCAGVEKVTNGKQTQVLAFVLMFLLGMIGHAIVQNDFNKIGTADVMAAAPTGPNPFAPVDAMPAPMVPDVTPSAMPPVITPTAPVPAAPVMAPTDLTTGAPAVISPTVAPTMPPTTPPQV